MAWISIRLVLELPQEKGSLLNIEAARKQQVDEFSEYLNKLSNLEKLYIKKVDELQVEVDKASAEANFQKSESKRAEELSLKSAAVLAENEAILRDSKVKSDELTARLKEIEKLELQIAERNKASVSENLTITHQQAEIEKKFKFIEMEERRLKLFEYNLNLACQDEAIKKKLEEIK